MTQSAFRQIQWDQSLSHRQHEAAEHGLLSLMSDY